MQDRLTRIVCLVILLLPCGCIHTGMDFIDTIPFQNNSELTVLLLLDAAVNPDIANASINSLAEPYTAGSIGLVNKYWKDFFSEEYMKATLYIVERQGETKMDYSEEDVLKIITLHKAYLDSVHWKVSYP